jgi:RHS repeat-associated protein
MIDRPPDRSRAFLPPPRSTGKERDAETGLDYFGARYYGSSMGRLLSPDPDNASAFLYPDDPQSWNGYAYARNNPLTYTDPTGEVYEVCQKDEKGKSTNCATISDADFRNLSRSSKNIQYSHGNVTTTNEDGSKTLVGSYRQIDVDLPGDPEMNRQAAAMIVNTFNDGMKEFGKNAAYAATGAIALRGIASGLGALNEIGIFKNTKVVINWAHKLTSVRPGHIPPAGSPAEITSAVEGAIQTGNYTMKAGGLIEGATTINGMAVGFRGRMIDGVARIATVFTKIGNQ